MLDSSQFSRKPGDPCLERAGTRAAGTALPGHCWWRWTNWHFLWQSSKRPSPKESVSKLTSHALRRNKGGERSHLQQLPKTSLPSTVQSQAPWCTIPQDCTQQGRVIPKRTEMLLCACFLFCKTKQQSHLPHKAVVRININSICKALSTVPGTHSTAS